ncbi:MAG: hypothetical protein QOH66_2841 [Actinomycetota bacterium]|jgi:uncharacterized protein (UPF0548 family)|nr:hypothetical protein [Actinomycetota bacterium]
MRNHGPFWIRRPGPTRLAQLFDEQRAERLTYREVGATAGQLPAGYHIIRQSQPLGREEGVFERATDGIRGWAPQRAAGIELLPANPDLVEGEPLLLSFRSFPFHVTAACRVVYVVDEPDRYGFGYGTLPVHPESGEEAFIVERDGNGEVRFTITAFSRPRVLLSRLGAPVARRVQASVTRRYLEGLLQAIKVP